MPSVRLCLTVPYTSFTHDHLFKSVCLLDDARRWFEASSRMCRYVPDGAVRAKKVGHPPVFQPYSYIHEETRSPRHMPISWTASVRDRSFRSGFSGCSCCLCLCQLFPSAPLFSTCLFCTGDPCMHPSQTRVKNGRNIKFLIVTSPHVHHNL